MTDNALKTPKGQRMTSLEIIKDKLARIDEARAKALKGQYEYDDGRGIRENACGWLEYESFAANEITKLTKALSVAVDDIERLNFALQMMIIQFNGNVPGMTKQQVFDSAIEVRYSSTANITTIANILSGGEDGSL